MSARLNDLTVKAIDQNKKEADDLRVDCCKRFHECVMNTIRTGLDQHAKNGKTKVNISAYQMNLLNTCDPIAETVMKDYVKKNPVIEGVKLKPYTFMEYKGFGETKKIYLHGSRTGVTFDWSKPDRSSFFSAGR